MIANSNIKRQQINDSIEKRFSNRCTKIVDQFFPSRAMKLALVRPFQMFAAVVELILAGNH